MNLAEFDEQDSMNLAEFKPGDPITWLHYSPTMPSADGELKRGAVVELIESPIGGPVVAVLAETQTGERLYVGIRGKRYVSGTPLAEEARTDPSKPAHPPEDAAAPRHFSTGDNMAAIGDVIQPGEKIGTALGIRYNGPAYYQALDMLIEMLGPEMRTAGHVSIDDGARALYCFRIETGPSLEEIDQRIDEIGATIREYNINI